MTKMVATTVRRRYTTVVLLVALCCFLPSVFSSNQRSVIDVHTKDEFERITQGRAIVIGCGLGLCRSSGSWVQDWKDFVAEEGWRFDQDIQFAIVRNQEYARFGHPAMYLYEQGTSDNASGLIPENTRDRLKKWKRLPDDIQRRITLTSHELDYRIQELVSEDDFSAFIKNRPRGAMVMYHVEWCSHCRSMARFLSRYLNKDYSEKIKYPCVRTASLDCSKLQRRENGRIPADDDEGSRHASDLIAKACRGNDRKSSARLGHAFPLVRLYQNETETGDYEGNAAYEGYMVDFLREHNVRCCW